MRNYECGKKTPAPLFPPSQFRIPHSAEYTGSMNVLLLSLGTVGDVHPFVGLGAALRERGHDVTLITNDVFKPLAADNGFRFVSLGSTKDFQEVLQAGTWVQSPGFWKKFKGVRTLVQTGCNTLAAQYQAIKDNYEPGRTVVAAPVLAVGARIAHEKLGVPLATIVLQPVVFRSVYKTPVIAGAPPIPDWLPPSAKRLLFYFLDVIADRFCRLSEVNAFRADLGLRPARRLVKGGWFSPQRVIGMFPDWFCEPQPDWAKQIHITGFPLCDGRANQDALPAEVESFLELGDPPIVFTPGSGMMRADLFFNVAVQATELLRRRGILLTRHSDHIPERLPVSIRHFRYVSFSQLLPRVAALVHHGGIGTLAEAMAAGIPQLVMPMAFDQPDNAARLKRLGVGDWLKPRAFRGPAVAQKLQHLLDSPEVASRCQAHARNLDRVKALEETCELIEELVEERRNCEW